jgi:hypothetical protein
VINLRKEELANTRKTRIKARKDNKNSFVTKDRVDIYHIISYKLKLYRRNNYARICKRMVGE